MIFSYGHIAITKIAASGLVDAVAANQKNWNMLNEEQRNRFAFEPTPRNHALKIRPRIAIGTVTVTVIAFRAPNLAFLYYLPPASSVS